VITANVGTTTVAVTAAASDILLGTEVNDFGTSALVFGGTKTNVRDVSLRNVNAGAIFGRALTGLTNLAQSDGLHLTMQRFAFPAVTLMSGGKPCQY